MAAYAYVDMESKSKFQAPSCRVHGAGFLLRMSKQINVATSARDRHGNSYTAPLVHPFVRSSIPLLIHSSNRCEHSLWMSWKGLLPVSLRLIPIGQSVRRSFCGLKTDCTD